MLLQQTFLSWVNSFEVLIGMKFKWYGFFSIGLSAFLPSSKAKTYGHRAAFQSCWEI